MELISSVTVGGGGASIIEFTSIPGTYTDLLVQLSHRDAYSSDTSISILIRVNSNSGSIYTSRMLRGSGSTVTSVTNSSTSLIVTSNFGQSNSTTANTFSNNNFYFPNYTSSSNKAVAFEGVAETNGAAIGQFLTAGQMSTTSAISSVQLYTGGGSTFMQYSTAYLYGILKGSGGATVASA
jgi:hypothetical protein